MGLCVACCVFKTTSRNRQRSDAAIIKLVSLRARNGYMIWGPCEVQFFLDAFFSTSALFFRSTLNSATSWRRLGRWLKVSSASDKPYPRRKNLRLDCRPAPSTSVLDVAEVDMLLFGRCRLVGEAKKHNVQTGNEYVLSCLYLTECDGRSERDRISQSGIILRCRAQGDQQHSRIAVPLPWDIYDKLRKNMKGAGPRAGPSGRCAMKGRVLPLGHHRTFRMCESCGIGKRSHEQACGQSRHQLGLLNPLSVRSCETSSSTDLAWHPG
jgi:hypothetical protein